MQAGSAEDVLVDGAGDVVVGGQDAGFLVTKLDGSDGSELWRYEVGTPFDLVLGPWRWRRAGTWSRPGTSTVISGTSPW